MCKAITHKLTPEANNAMESKVTLEELKEAVNKGKTKNHQVMTAFRKNFTNKIGTSSNKTS
jgi:hypothetical protein